MPQAPRLGLAGAGGAAAFAQSLADSVQQWKRDQAAREALALEARRVAVGEGEFGLRQEAAKAAAAERQRQIDALRAISDPALRTALEFGATPNIDSFVPPEEAGRRELARMGPLKQFETELDIQRDAAKPPTPRPPTFAWVLGPDGKMLYATPQEIRAGGLQPAPTRPEANPSRQIAEVAARNPSLLKGMTPSQSGPIMAAIMEDPELMAIYDETRMAPLRDRSRLLLGALGQLVVTDQSGKPQLTRGAQAIFGEWMPPQARAYAPGQAATDANAALQQVIGQEIVNLLGEMKSQSQTGATGFGALSAPELAILEAASTQLGLRLSDDAALTQLLTIQEKLQKVLMPSPGVSMSGPETARPLESYDPRDLLTAGHGQSTVPTDIRDALSTEVPGRHTMSDGSVWRKHPDGRITKEGS